VRSRDIHDGTPIFRGDTGVVNWDNHRVLGSQRPFLSSVSSMLRCHLDVNKANRRPRMANALAVDTNVYDGN